MSASSSSASSVGSSGQRRDLAFSVLRNSLQNQHLTARAWMGSAQKGQGLVSISINSIKVYRQAADFKIIKIRRAKNRGAQKAVFFRT